MSAAKRLEQLIAAQRGTENPAVSGTVAERQAAIQLHAAQFRGVPNHIFKQALAALQERGFKIAGSKVRAARDGCLESLQFIADRALAFSRKSKDSERPIAIGPAADLLCALAAFALTDRTSIPQTEEAFTEWVTRQQVAGYALGAAEAMFHHANLGIVAVAGESLALRSKQSRGGDRRVAQRRATNHEKKEKAVSDFRAERQADPGLTVYKWAWRHDREEKYGGVSYRALQRWLRDFSGPGKAR